MTKTIKTGSEYFKFKHFSLRNSNAAFKVNTDGVLLAAWTTLEKGRSCLDIGTGSGVIALILSQRYPENNFSAIDIDSASYNEATYNFRLNEKPIKCFLDDFKSFRPKVKYDHFVSNPPYFKSSTLPSSEKKQVSKHQGILDMKNLWSGVSSLSKNDSKLSVIIPFDLNNEFDNYSKEYGFGLKRETRVYGKKNGDLVRVLKEYQNGYKAEVEMNSIHIRDKENGGYGKAYMELCKDLYLHF